MTDQVLHTYKITKLLSLVHNLLNIKKDRELAVVIGNLLKESILSERVQCVKNHILVNFNIVTKVRESKNKFDLVKIYMAKYNGFPRHVVFF
jgi:hypothetical protein